MPSFNAFAFNTVPRLICEIGSAAKLGQLNQEAFPAVRQCR